MPNDFYTPTGNPTDNSNIVSSDMRAEFAAISAGFNKLPTLTSNGYKIVYINASGSAMDVVGGNGLLFLSTTGTPSISRVVLTQPVTGATLTLLDGKTLTVNKTLTLDGTDGVTVTFPATNATIARTDAAQTFTGVQDFDDRVDANAGLTVAGAAFNSRGITDNATAKALTLSGSGANSVTIASSATKPVINTTAGQLSLGGAGTDVFTLSGATQSGTLASAAAGISTQLSLTKTGVALSGAYPAQIDLNHAAFAGGNPFGIAWRSSSRYDWIGQLQTSYDLAIVVNTSGTPVNAVKFNGSGTATFGAGIVVTGTATPEADNTRTLGTSALRWSTVYAGTGTINTSDAREKTPVVALTADEINAAKQLAKEIGTYKWLSAIASKGDAARMHVGLTVQRAIEIMTANNLNPFTYGFICFDEWDDVFRDYAAVPAVEAVEAAPAVYVEDWREEIVDVAGEEVIIRRRVLVEITPEVVAVEAAPAKPAWREQTQVAGNLYAFRYDELNVFIAAGFEARLAALEA